jgi:hypothetical protein
MIDSPATTYSERKKMREELQRQEVEGVIIDPAAKCKCDRCGQIHFRPRKEANEISNLRQQENQSNAQS